MPILDLNNDYETKEEFVEKKPFRSPEELGTSTLFHKEKPLDTIIRYPKGSKWEVSYFLQIRDINDTLVQPDVNLPATTQKYNRIDKLILYIQSAINQDNIENISGEALINAGFLPNKDDVFLATLTGGREAIFIITEVQNRTYNLHYAYLVNFKIFCFAEDNPRIYNDILNKVMKSYVYDKDYLLDYSAPVILASDYKSKLDLKIVLEDTIDYYFKMFVNRDKNVIALRTTTSVYVDTFIVDFIFKIINQSDYNVLSKLNNIAIDFREKVPYTIWDAILSRNPGILKLCVKDIGFKYHPAGYQDLLLRNMYYLDIHFIANRLDGTAEGNIPLEDISNPRPADYYPPTNFNSKSYAVSEDVYNMVRDSNYILDKLLVDYLEGKMINIDELFILINQYTYWETREQFYLIPILIVLIKDAINNTFKSL